MSAVVRTTRSTRFAAGRRSRWSLLTATAALVAGFAVSTGGPAVGQTALPPGARPTLILLCKYADRPTEPTLGPDWVQQAWLGDPANSIDGAIREASYGQVNLSGSRAFGWFTMSSNFNAYPFRDVQGTINRAMDCVAAARRGGVDTTGYRYLAVYMNTSEGIGGGVATRTNFNGTTPEGATNFDMLMVGDTGLTSSGLVRHELGHVMGGDHVAGTGDCLGACTFNGTNWDQSWFNRADGTFVSGTYGAANRDQMGFIPADRKVVFAGGTQRVALTRLNQPGPTGPLMVEIPVSASLKYVVSARTRIGYDAKASSPGGGPIFTPGIFVERVNIGTPQFGRPDNFIIQQLSKPGGDRTTADGVWLPGQTFTDAASGLSIRVERFDDQGGEVTITGPAGTPATTTAAPATTTTAAPATTAAPVTTAAPATTAAPTTAPAPPAATGGPAADAIANAPAQAVPAAIGPQDTNAATTETGEPLPCSGIGKTVWFRVTAPTSGPLTATTAGSDYDTVLAAYSGPASFGTFGTLNQINCNDDANNTPQSSITVNAVAGTTYWFQAGGYGAAGGNLRLTVG